MANISDSVCLNHPNSPAVTRCATCGKPICSQCIVSKNGSDYCSQKCADNAADSVGRVNSALESEKRIAARRRIRTLIILVILIAAAAAGYYFYQQNKDTVDQHIKQAGDTVSKGAADAKKSIQKGIPTDSAYKRNRENLTK